MKMTLFKKFSIVAVVCLVLCHGKVSKKTVTIGKCCGLDEILTYEQKCIKSFNSSWDLRVIYNGSLVHYKEKLPQKWVLKENLRPSCAKPVIQSLDKRVFLPKMLGPAIIVEYDQQINSSQYCIDYDYVLFCPNDASPEGFTSVLVKKCCGQDAVYSDSNSNCINLKNSSTIEVGPNKRLGAGFPNCDGSNRIQAGTLDQGHIFSNGSLWMNASDVTLPAGNFCLEFIAEHLDRPATIVTCQDYLPPVILPTIDEGENLKFTIYPIGLAISAIFLAATLAAGSLLPASHHVLHWRCQTNYVACLLVGDVLLCITQVTRVLLKYHTPCFIIAVAMHFFFLAAFFWLNTMCFNIWWTFRDLRPQSTELSQERIRFYLYQAYAWGVPFLIAFVGAVADLTHYEGDGGFIKPSFAENKCWFKDNTEIFTYFFGPLGTLLVVNLVLFILTARELTCGLWKRELVKSTTERAALGRVCLKLVVVMGVTWIADVLSWAVGGPQWLWYITDVCNCLQGVFIFIVVGCQPQVLSAVKRSWCLLRHGENGAAGNLNHHSSSSQGLPSVAGDTLTHSSSITNTSKSIPLQTNCWIFSDISNDDSDSTV